MPSEWDRFREGYGDARSFIERGYLSAGSPVPSNVPPLDAALCGGYRPGLHVIGGEPGAGKSALGLYVSMRSAMVAARVMYVSLEMSAAQCWERCASYVSIQPGSPCTPFRWGDTWRIGAEARRRLETAAMRGASQECYDDLLKTDPVAVASAELERSCPGLVLADAAALHNVDGIRDAARRGRSAGLNLLVVDYLQYVECEGVTDEYTRVSAVSKALNRLGVELSMPVLALASCNRAGNRKGEPPSMHSFKGSGDIEYHSLSAAIVEADPEDKATRKLHIVKNRFGSVTGADDPILFRFDGSHNSFEPVPF